MQASWSEMAGVLISRRFYRLTSCPTSIYLPGMKCVLMRAILNRLKYWIVRLVLPLEYTWIF